MRPIDADALIESIEQSRGKNSIYAQFVRAYIKDAPTIDAIPWIPCSERLPELKTECLITFLSWSGSPVIDIDSYDYDGEDGWFSHMDKVIAWMPLPEPYEAREDNETNIANED